MTHSLPELGYSFDALEPHIDAKTMEIHYSKHHQAYVDKLNKALEGNNDLKEKSPEEIVKNIGDISEEIRVAVKNNGGGHFNHSFFWKILKKDVEAKGEILEAINNKFGSLEKFNENFKEAAITQFGSGWAWLVLNNSGELEIVKTGNQDCPLSEGKRPLLAIDIWEHAYYLKYQNKRPDYVDAFLKVINWDKVNENFLGSKK